MVVVRAQHHRHILAVKSRVVRERCGLSQQTLCQLNGHSPRFEHQVRKWTQLHCNLDVVAARNCSKRQELAWMLAEEGAQRHNDLKCRVLTGTVYQTATGLIARCVCWHDSFVVQQHHIIVPEVLVPGQCILNSQPLALDLLDLVGAHRDLDGVNHRIAKAVNQRIQF